MCKLELGALTPTSTPKVSSFAYFPFFYFLKILLIISSFFFWLYLAFVGFFVVVTLTFLLFYFILFILCCFFSLGNNFLIHVFCFVFFLGGKIF
jgi:hypothetical protein